jgi:DNA modification methylase
VYFYPAQKREEHGPAVDGWRNKLYWGDNLQVMGHLLRQFRGQVQLVYIDPPFDSKAEYKKEIAYRGKSTESERTAFEEKQYSDIWTNDEYLQFMFERFCLIRELLAPSGTVYVHCDWHRNHHLRALLDEVFGPERILNECVWAYFGFKRSTSRKFPQKHDTIISYTKGDEYTWNTQYRPYDPKYLARFKKDSEGRLYRDDVNPTAGGARTIYLDPDKGDIVEANWTDIPPVNPVAKERTDYPTQKPEGVLERIIKASSNPGDIVMDCFMGSGTTQAAAMRLGRRFIGADINLGAIQTATARLLAVARELTAGAPGLFDAEKRRLPFYTGLEIYTVNHYDVFRNPVEARDVMMQAHAVRPNTTPTPWHGETGDGQDTRQVYVMPVNCIATKADLQPIIENLRWKDLIEKFRETPRRPVLRCTLLCMGHEPDLAATLVKEVRDGVGQQGVVVDVLVEDVLRGKAKLEFKKESDGKVTVRKGKLRIESFYPMNLLQKLSFDRDHVDDWRKLVASVMIDWNYDGAVLRPKVVETAKTGSFAGVYDVPEDAGTICVKITDLLSDSWETTVEVDDA